MAAVDPDLVLPLAGMRVLDLTDGVGAMCTRILADLGAEVLLIEPPSGLAARAEGPTVAGVSMTFVTQTANKRAIRLDWTQPAGRTELLKLAADADILVESQRAGTLTAAGLGAEVFHRANPRLVVTSITDFGQDGPYRDWYGSDWVHLALSSVLARSGIPGEPPLMPPGRLAQEHAGAQAAWVTLAAYWSALETGAGEHIDLSVLEATVLSMDPAFGIGGTATAAMKASELPPGRPDVSHLYPIFRCLDGRVRICLLAPRQWRAMFGWLNEPHEFADPRYDMIVTRYRERDRLYPAIAALFADQKVADLVEQGHDRGVPVEAVRSPADLLLDQHLEARGAWADVTLPGGRAGRMPHGFLEIDGKRVGFRALLDEGTDDRRFRTRHAAPKSLANGNMRDSAVPPLTGLRVLDLGVIVVGAETGRLFADLGADVIKIESEAFPDGSRQSSRKGTVDSGTAWGHRGKRSLGLDLRDPRGRALFLQLASLSDVVLSNFRPGTLESLGIGIEQVRAVNPAIVMLDSSALGSTGPSSRRMGYGPLVRASAGLTSLWCDPDVPDGYCDAITVYPDHTAARAGATGALAALIARRHTGHGASVSVSQTEVMLTQLSAELLRESLIPGSLVAVGNHGELDAPCGVYPAAGEDQWCAITVRGDDQWRRLCEAIGAEDLAAETALNTAAGRVARRGVIDERVRSWTRARSPHEAMTLLQAVGVPAGAMLRPGELICDPHLRARKVFATLEQPALGPLTSERAPALFSRIAPAPLRPAPLQGENTREVVRELLGLSTSEINELVNRGILQDPASATVA